MTSQENPKQQQKYPFADEFDEHKIETQFLLSKPTCFLIVGKPGSGKTTLAKKLAASWSCILIEASALINQNLKNETSYGLMIKSILEQGERISEEMVVRMMFDKLNSPEAAHYGYVLCGFPSLSEQFLKIPDQIELIKNLKLKPDFIINIKCPDYDLWQRLSGQKQDPVTGNVYKKEQWDPVIVKKVKKPRETDEEGEEEEEEEEEEDEEEEIAAEWLIREVVARLVKRPEDFVMNVQHRIACYKDTMLRPLEDLMVDQDPQYLIELDGNKDPDEQFNSLLACLQTMGLKAVAVPKRLVNPEEESLPEDMETNKQEELFRTLSSNNIVAPRFRWRRSRWGRACPVALKEKNFVMGVPDLAVGFLDKMYVLSSHEAMEAFLANPRPYLLPPMPRPPCKVAVLGSPFSGKTTLCHMIAFKYGGKVLDMARFLQPKIEEARNDFVEKVKAEALPSIIEEVKNKIMEKLLEEKQGESRLIEFEKNIARVESDRLPLKPNHTIISSKCCLPNPPQKTGLFFLSYLKTEVDAQASSDKETHDSEDEEEEENGNEHATKSEYRLNTDLLCHDQKNTAEPAISTPSVPDVTIDHPEVQEKLVETVVAENTINLRSVYQKCPYLVQESIAELQIINADDKDAGGWVLDNFPQSTDYWIAMLENGLIPNTIIYLSNEVDGGKFLLSRLYRLNEGEVNAKILQRLKEEHEIKKQEEEAARQAELEALRLAEEENKVLKMLKAKIVFTESLEMDEKSTTETEGKVVTETEQETSGDHSQTGYEPEPEPEPELEPEPGLEPELKLEPAAEPEPELESEPEPGPEPEPEPGYAEVSLPEIVEGDYPDVQEMDPYRTIIQQSFQQWKALESGLSEAVLTQFAPVEVADKTPEDLLQEVISVMETPFKYRAWQMSGADQEEEEEDNQAELDAEENDEEEEEEEEEEDEESDAANREKKRFHGDSKHFCPVELKEKCVLYPGERDISAKYKEKIYYFSTEEAREKFLKDPQDFVAYDEPLKAPPLRLLILGVHGAGKTVNAHWLAEKLGFFHIQFKEYLQEMIIHKTKKKIGPEYEEEPIEEEIPDIEVLATTEGENIPAPETENQVEEVIFTEEEEAIRSNLIEDEQLPLEVLDSIVPTWWHQEPFRTQGFILENFPQIPDEAEYLKENGLFPDAAIILNVDDIDVTDRILPARLTKWKEKQKRKEELVQKVKQMKKTIRDDQIAKRRAEILAERAEKKARKQNEKAEMDGEENEEMEEEEEDEDIETILAEEFPEEEVEDEEEETEADAIERIKSEIVEKFEAQHDAIVLLKEQLTDINIPCIEINGGRKLHIVNFVLYKMIKSLVENRESHFEKCFKLSMAVAQKLLKLSYKHLSCFGVWDPVKLSEGDVIHPLQSSQNIKYPLVHRQFIYFFVSKENQEKFMAHPIKYIRQPKPKPAVPIRIAITGPPKSGKSTVARKFVSEYGLERLSVGDAIRLVLSKESNTELAVQINKLLMQGLTVPDELAVQCLEVALMNYMCNIRGFVLDGCPVTKRFVDILEVYSIIPVRIVELRVEIKECLKRGLLDRKSLNSLPYPLHDSLHILVYQSGCYNQEIKATRGFYQEQHQNWSIIEGHHSKWWVWDKVLKEARESIKQIQNYLERIREETGKSACVTGLCITPQELESRLGGFGYYCPVSLALRGELVDCSMVPSQQFAAEFQGHYYKMASQEELEKFLDTPEQFLPPLALHLLPPPDMLPKMLTAADVKARFPKEAELQGFCPVTYLDGKQRYEALIPGSIDFAVEYRDKIFIFEAEEKRQKFMRLPEKYWDQKLPTKIPPKKDPVLLTSLPMLGYLEQGIANAVIKALTAVGCAKPKYPYLSVKKSALLYVAFHLKAFNPNSSAYVRKKYKRKLEQFEETCELISYLGSKMTCKYREPKDRPIDFDHKLETFLALQDVAPSTI
uniref:Adenylate kinase 9 n=1 Tax=Latimeria chalumnae TaxID=7897 RepID=H3AND6_LATCH